MKEYIAMKFISNIARLLTCDIYCVRYHKISTEIIQVHSIFQCSVAST
jgi:hypothetical protein